VDYLKLKQRIKQLLGLKTTPPSAPETPKPAAYSPELVKKYAWEPGQGRFPGLSGNAHQRRIARRKQS